MGQLSLSPARENFPAIMFLCLYGALYCYLGYVGYQLYRQRSPTQSEEGNGAVTGGSSGSSGGGDGGRMEGGRYPIVQRYMEKLKRQDEQMRSSTGRASYLGGVFFVDIPTQGDKVEKGEDAK